MLEGGDYFWWIDGEVVIFRIDGMRCERVFKV